MAARLSTLTSGLSHKETQVVLQQNLENITWTYVKATRPMVRSITLLHRIPSWHMKRDAPSGNKNSAVPNSSTTMKRCTQIPNHWRWRASDNNPTRAFSCLCWLTQYLTSSRLVVSNPKAVPTVIFVLFECARPCPSPPHGGSTIQT
jgi:hypothetical protein